MENKVDVALARAGKPSLRFRGSGVLDPPAHFEGAGERAVREGELAVAEVRLALRVPRQARRIRLATFAIRFAETETPVVLMEGTPTRRNEVSSASQDVARRDLDQARR